VRADVTPEATNVSAIRTAGIFETLMMLGATRIVAPAIPS